MHSSCWGVQAFRRRNGGHFAVWMALVEKTEVGLGIVFFYVTIAIKGGVGLFFIGLVVKGIFWKTVVCFVSWVWEKRCGKFIGKLFVHMWFVGGAVGSRGWIGGENWQVQAIDVWFVSDWDGSYFLSRNEIPDIRFDMMSFQKPSCVSLYLIWFLLLFWVSQLVPNCTLQKKKNDITLRWHVKTTNLDGSDDGISRGAGTSCERLGSLSWVKGTWDVYVFFVLLVDVLLLLLLLLLLWLSGLWLWLLLWVVVGCCDKYTVEMIWYYDLGVVFWSRSNIVIFCTS